MGRGRQLTRWPRGPIRLTGMGQRYAGLSWDGFMEEKQQIFGKSRRREGRSGLFCGYFSQRAALMQTERLLIDQRDQMPQIDLLEALLELF